MKHPIIAFTLLASLLLGGCNFIKPPAEPTAEKEGGSLEKGVDNQQNLQDKKKEMDQFKARSAIEKYLTIRKEHLASRDWPWAESRKNITLKSKIYEDLETGLMVYESLEEGLRFKFEYPKDFKLIELVDLAPWRRGDKRYYQHFNGSYFFNLLRLDFVNDYKTQIDKIYPPITISLSNFLWKDSKPSLEQWFKPLANQNECNNQEVVNKETQVNNYKVFQQTIECPDSFAGFPVLLNRFFINTGNIIWEFKANYWIIDIDSMDLQKQDKVFSEVVSSFTLL